MRDVMHEDQLHVTPEQVAALVADQFGDHAGPVTRVASSGTVVELFRVGEHHAARFPLQSTSPDETRAELVREVETARMIEGHMPVATPHYVGIGEPGHGYPAPWTLTDWIAGDSLADQTSSSTTLAEEVAAFIVALRQYDPEGRRSDPAPRGGLLGTDARDTWVQSCLDRSTHLVDVPSVRALWTDLRVLPRPDHESWTHRDLMPGNLIVDPADHGHLRAVIDGAGLTVCDPAVDLMCAWNLFTGDARHALRAAVDPDDATWQRARAWALEQAAGCLAYYEHTNPVMSRTARRTLQALLDDA